VETTLWNKSLEVGSSLRGDIVGVVDSVATHGGSHALGFLFERMVSDNKFAVGDVFDSVLGMVEK